MGDLGFGWDKTGAKWGGVVEVLDPALQAAITDVRTSGLNIMMSMKEEGKPVSFVEDCAVPLEHLAEYTARLTEVFEKHGTRGTWYAHAVGRLPACAAGAEPAAGQGREGDARHRRRGLRDGARIQGLAFRRAWRRHRALRIPRAHVRPAAGARVRGGEGPLRSGRPVQSRQDRARAEIRRPRRISAYGPDYRGEEIATQLDWSAYPGAGGGFQGAVEMCNNNGACRKLDGGVMCPSYRVTRDERDVTRGRANSLRLALTGQLGPDALASDEMAETMKLCVSCKACRRECPTGVDMARMKIEVQAARAAKHRACRCATGWSAICRAMRRMRRAAVAAESARCGAGRGVAVGGDCRACRRGAACRGGAADVFRDVTGAPRSGADRRAGMTRVVLFADTFNRYFERENLDAALAVLNAAGYRVQVAQAGRRRDAPALLRPHVSVGRRGRCRRARKRERTLAALAPFVDARRAGGRARAELHPRLPRRDSGAGRKPMRRTSSRRSRSPSRNSWRASTRPGGSICR